MPLFLAPSLFRPEVLKEDLGNRKQLLARWLLAGAAIITASIPCLTGAELLQTLCGSFHNIQLFLTSKKCLGPTIQRMLLGLGFAWVVWVFLLLFQQILPANQQLFFSFLTLTARFTSSIFFLECNKDGECCFSENPETEGFTAGLIS